MSEIGSYEDAAMKALEKMERYRNDGSCELEIRHALLERDRLLVFNAELDRERAKALKERDAALAVLKRRGRHSKGCLETMQRGYICVCGLDAALRKP